MIHFTLLLSHIARAMPPCSDFASPEDLYDMYDDEQLVLATHDVTWDATYDTNGVACSNGLHGLAGTYPQFKNFPDFPYLGGAYDTKWGSSNCGKCWKLTDNQTGRWIYFTVIEAAEGLNIGEKAFIALNGGTVGSGTLEAEARLVSGHHCGFYDK